MVSEMGDTLQGFLALLELTGKQGLALTSFQSLAEEAK